MDRRQLLAGAAWLAMPAIARAAPRTIRFSTGLPASHPICQRMAAAAATVKQDSGGELLIDLDTGAQTDGTGDILRQLRDDRVDLIAISSLVVARSVPQAGVALVGFAWPTQERALAAFDGPLGQALHEELAGAGLAQIGRLSGNGFREITTSGRGIQGPADVKGMKIRTATHPLVMQLFSALSARPNNRPFAEIFGALKAGKMEAQENPLNIVSALRLGEVQSRVALTHHLWDGYWMIASRERWATFPEDQRTLAQKAVDDAMGASRADVAAHATKILDALAARGLTIDRPDGAAFRDALAAAGFYDDAAEAFTPTLWTALQRSSDIG